jgi:hypothetical protein
MSKWSIERVSERLMFFLMGNPKTLTSIGRRTTVLFTLGLLALAAYFFSRDPHFYPGKLWDGLICVGGAFLFVSSYVWFVRRGRR